MYPMRLSTALEKSLPQYRQDKHEAKHPHTTYFPIAPRQANITWCLRCGVKGVHATADCPNESPPILFPTGADKTELEGICTWCAIRGHDHKSCMRRAPQQADANKAAIDSLSSRVDAMTKSFESVAALESSVSDLQSDMRSLISWRSQQAQAQAQLETRVTTMESWRSTASSTLTQCVGVSRFEAFLASRFAETERKAQESLPRSDFDAYVARMETAARPSKHRAASSPPAGDAAMTPVRSTGSSRIASELDTAGEVAASAKRNVARRAGVIDADAPSSSSTESPMRPPASKPGVDSLLNPATPSTPGAAAFNNLSPPPAWLMLPPEASDPWEDEAISVLMDVWSTHMDSRLQQWSAKHGGVELGATAAQLARQPMSESKRSGIVAVLRGAKTPPRVFTNLNQ